jgi:hypothetical protein
MGPQIPMGVSIAILLLVGWAALFKTGAVVEFARRDYRNSGKLVQNWPFANMVLKEWFPIYLRGMGVFAWLIAAILIATFPH